MDTLRNSGCKLCPLWETAEHVCLIGKGRYPTDLMLVGEAPGHREDDIGKPFQGRAGQLLDGILDVLKLQRKDIYISNSVHCRPPDNRKPTNKEIEVCANTYLAPEVQRARPKVIIAMGTVAGQGLLQQKVTVGSHRSRIWYTKKPFLPNIPVIVTYHPAAALRNDNLLDYIVKDFEGALEVLTNGIPKEVRLDYRLAGLEDIPQIHDEALRSGRVAVDLETDGFDPFLPGRSIISIQLSSTAGKAYYLLWNQEVGKALEVIFKDKRLTKIFHNGKFDLKWLKEKEVEVKGPIDDTMVDIHIIDENFPGKDLETVTTAFTSLKHHKQELSQYRKQNKVDFKDIPIEVALPYGCGDADGTGRVSKVFAKKIIKKDLVPLHKHEMRKLKMFVEVEANGCKIDTSIIDELAETLEGRIRDSQRRLDKRAGQEINPRSSKQVCELLYRRWKLPALGIPKTYGGPPSANSAEDTLQRLLESEYVNELQQKVIRGILGLREDSKNLSTYILGMSDFLREGDFIHPNFKLIGTVTGRLSCADPNLQNIPRDGDIKRLFISRYGRQGRIVSLDVSQGELRWGAHYSKEPTLTAYFRAGVKDIHRSVASRLYKIPEEEVDDKQRKRTKIVNFGIFYGISADGLFYKNRGAFDSIKQAAQFRRKWLDEFPRWEEYVGRVHRSVIENGFVRSDFGRYRHLPILDPKSQQGKASLRQAVNSPIQGSLCDYTCMCGYNAWYRIKKAKLRRVHPIAQVHDQWLWDVHEDHVDEVAAILFDSFRNPNFREFDVKLHVPMDAEVSVGLNWKELEEYVSPNS